MPTSIADCLKTQDRLLLWWSAHAAEVCSWSRGGFLQLSTARSVAGADPADGAGAQRGWSGAKPPAGLVSGGEMSNRRRARRGLGGGQPGWWGCCPMKGKRCHRQNTGRPGSWPLVFAPGMGKAPQT